MKQPVKFDKILNIIKKKVNFPQNHKYCSSSCTTIKQNRDPCLLCLSKQSEADKSNKESVDQHRHEVHICFVLSPLSSPSECFGATCRGIQDGGTRSTRELQRSQRERQGSRETRAPKKLEAPEIEGSRGAKGTRDETLQRRSQRRQTQGALERCLRHQGQPAK